MTYQGRDGDTRLGRRLTALALSAFGASVAFLLAALLVASK
jgi:hypothetical protein